MTKKLSAAHLREMFAKVGVLNATDFANTSSSPPFVVYRNQDRKPGGVSAAWQVKRVGYLTAAKGYEKDQGHRTFSIYHVEHRQDKLDEAMAWAEERYGVSEWVKTCYGSWMPAKFVHIRTAELLEQVQVQTTVHNIINERGTP